ncbi:DNA repair and recombination protein rad5c [Colletotrichum musicola]|uniref:DNA repair and recombination protein rad5c n=1 Tax=Colletotrichum musicola TaxID=2175873 RepID=A0A8H6KBG5_9PEZI|nr:DNA repair and recombination protein rad5c [Colletotrichum musicola]
MSIITTIEGHSPSLTSTSTRATAKTASTMSLKRLLNDDEDDCRYADPSAISPYGGSVSGSSYQSADDITGNRHRQPSFQAPEYPRSINAADDDNDEDDYDTPVMEVHDSMHDVFNTILFPQLEFGAAADQLGSNLNLGDASHDAPYNLEYDLQHWADTNMASPGSYTSPRSSPSGSSQDSLPATHSPSLVPESSVAGSDSCSSAGDDEVQKVCYGMLYNVDVKLIGDMGVIDTKLRESHHAAVHSKKTQYQRFSLLDQQEHVLLAFRDGNNTEFGYLRSGPRKTLSPLLGRHLIEFEPIAPTVTLRETIARAKKPAEAMVKVDINIYGPRSQAQYVGDKLTEGKLWLQRPTHPRKDVEHENPHLLKLEGLEALTVTDVREVNSGGPAKRQPREENLRRMMLEVYDSMKNPQNRERVDGDKGLSNNLLPHQQEALAWMLRRESGNIEENRQLWYEMEVEGQKWFRHKITKVKQKTKPDERGGGILADEMGMGKSLSILSLIVKTLEEGRQWAEHENSNDERSKEVTYSGSTLVVVSSALLIYNWENEVKKHVDGGLSCVKYHGPGREKNPDEIRNSDIVVTTYNTLSAEYEKKSSILHRIGWYRVVLDEAHIIRRPATTFYHACRALQANSRWCLTGTPIQNRLSDIGALFAFIRAHPFDNPAIFRRFIEVPFEQNSEDPQKVKERLIMLLDSLCLRRTKDLIKLAGLHEEIKELTFSPEERRQYEKTKKILIRTIKQRVGEVEKSSKFGLFQANLQMRILCNHGTYQKPFSWHRRAYRLDEREAVVSAMGQNVEIVCTGCRQPMPILGSSRMGHEFEEQCSHVFCSECLEESDLSTAAPGAQKRHCPVCEWTMKSARAQRPLAPGLPVVRVNGPADAADVDMPDAPVQASFKEEDEEYFNPTGKSTKMEALIQDVKKDLGQTKSIIFSCWTRTLRLVEKYLKEAGIDHLRIDGDCSLPQRQHMLEEFAKSDDKRVLIMTTGTGAFGLNLTCANRVFIVELQWNPSVENQAIARAMRLGQGQEVFVTRYVIKDTVEVEMRSQQQIKKDLAAIGFDDYEEMDESHD